MNGDELLARVLREHAEVEHQLDEFRNLGRAIGAVYAGVLLEGVPEDDALTITQDWMECQLFDRVSKYAAQGWPPPPEDTDSDTEPAA
jgi:hypothetical protein